jgi:hypothetical protein
MENGGLWELRRNGSGSWLAISTLEVAPGCIQTQALLGNAVTCLVMCNQETEEPCLLRTLIWDVAGYVPYHLLIRFRTIDDEVLPTRLPKLQQHHT